MNAKFLCFAAGLAVTGAANAIPDDISYESAEVVGKGEVQKARFGKSMNLDGTINWTRWYTIDELQGGGSNAARGADVTYTDAYDSMSTSHNVDLNLDGVTGSTFDETIGQSLCNGGDGFFNFFGFGFNVQRMGRSFVAEPGTEGNVIDTFATLTAFGGDVINTDPAAPGEPFCIQPIVSWVVFDENSDPVDSDGDTIPDDVGGFVVYDDMGNDTGDVTFFKNATADTDGDGTPDVPGFDPADFGDQDNDGLLDGFSGAIAIVFSFPTRTADGTPIYDATPCPDLNDDGLENDGVRPPIGLISIDASVFGTVGDNDLERGILANFDEAVDFFGSEDDLPRIPADGDGTFYMDFENDTLVPDPNNPGATIVEPAEGCHFALWGVAADIRNADDFAFPANQNHLDSDGDGVMDFDRPGAANSNSIWFEGLGADTANSWSTQPVDRIFSVQRNNPAAPPEDIEALLEAEDDAACRNIGLAPAIYIASGGAPAAGRLCADVNNDGILNGADFNAWLGAFSSMSLLADQNFDGILNGADFNAWLGNFSAGENGPTCNP